MADVTIIDRDRSKFSEIMERQRHFNRSLGTTFNQLIINSFKNPAFTKVEIHLASRGII